MYFLTYNDANHIKVLNLCANIVFTCTYVSTPWDSSHTSMICLTFCAICGCNFSPLAPKPRKNPESSPCDPNGRVWVAVCGRVAGCWQRRHGGSPKRLGRKTSRVIFQPKIKLRELILVVSLFLRCLWCEQNLIFCLFVFGAVVKNGQNNVCIYYIQSGSS